MKRYIIKGGKVTRVPEIDRGAFLVWPEEEWRKRNERMVASGTRKSILAAVCMYIILVSAILFNLITEFDSSAWTGQVLWIMLGALVPPALIIIPNLITRWGLRNLPLVGLYENGVDLGDNIFLPYREVARVDRKKGWVRMRPMYPWILPFGLRIPERWALRLDLLGEEGLEELEARVAGRPTGEEPPRLVLYGG